MRPAPVAGSRKERHPVHAADYVAFWKAYVEKGIGKF